MLISERHLEQVVQVAIEGCASKQPIRRNDDIKTMLRLYARRKTPIVHKCSSYRHAFRHLEPPNLLHDLVHNLRAYFSPPFYLNYIDGAKRLNKKVNLATLAALCPPLYIRCRRQNERTLYAKMGKQVSDMIDYQVLELVPKL